MANSSLYWPDYLVIAGYFSFVLVVGLVSSRRSRGDSISGYFLASRNMHWIPVGASLFASNIGSGHFIGLAGSGAASGIGTASFELNAMYVLMMLGWLFVPVYMSSGIYTMPEYLRERFGGQRIRIYLSVLALFLYVFTKISADLYAGALFIQAAIGQSSAEWLYISVLILLAIAAVFTVAGGLTAVIWTDFVQTILMILGAFVLMTITFSRIGGYTALFTKFPYAVASNYSHQFEDCAYPPWYSLKLFRPIAPGESDIPWTGMVFGMTINAIWYWCADQVIVQRTLASRSMVYAKAGCILAAFLKLLPLWLLVFPGMGSRILFPDEVACVDPDRCKEICGSEGGCTNIAYVKLVLELLPGGMRGLMLAVMMAALMSSLTSIFNSASTIFTMDIWILLRSKAFKTKNVRDIEVEQLIVGRIFVLILVIISVIWIPVIQSSANSQLFIYIQSIQSFLSPPICAVYLLAIFLPRTTEPAAFWGLMIGFLMGLVRFVLEFSFVAPSCGSIAPDTRPFIIKLLIGSVHYLHFAIFSFVFTLAVTLAISYLTPPIPKKCLHRLTFQSRRSLHPRLAVEKFTKQAEEVDELPGEEPAQGEESSSLCKQLLYRLCGMSEQSQTPEQRQEESAKQRDAADEIREKVDFLHESANGKFVVNFAAVTCLVIATAVFAFYA